MQNTKTISNDHWLNARVSSDYKHNTFEVRVHGIWFNIQFISGIWYDGVWYKGIWRDGFWINGTWNIGAVNYSFPWGNIKIMTVSPKVNFKPKRTLSLNRAKYGE